MTVTQPEITVIPEFQFIGSGLQDPHIARLGGSVHGGVTVRIASNDPAIALVAANATTPGTAFVDVFVPDGSTDASLYVQGVARCRPEHHGEPGAVRDAGRWRATWCSQCCRSQP